MFRRSHVLLHECRDMVIVDAIHMQSIYPPVNSYSFWKWPTYSFFGNTLIYRLSTVIFHGHLSLPENRHLSFQGLAYSNLWETFNMFQPYLEWLVGIFIHILMGSLNPSVDHVPIETSIEFIVFPLENWILHIHWCHVAQKFMVGIWGSSRFENSCGPSKPPHSLCLSGVSIQTIVNLQTLPFTPFGRLI